jgi:NADPH-dependent glutamate synthase beta subunit-like oxidoreductase/bacterioferritin-associated ferredoxin
MAYTQPKERPIERQILPPCNAECPVGNDIEGFVSLLQAEKWDDALHLLRTTNPLPGVTGRICDRPCEAACNRGWFDQSVSIKALERALGDYGAQKAQEISADGPRHKEKVGIIGSGPAGLSCAYHLIRKGFGVTVFEQKGEIGGILRFGIPAYRLPKDVLDREIGGLHKLGIDFKLNQKWGDTLLTEKDLESYDAIYLALGFHKSGKLGIPGEDCPQAMPGLAFLEQINSGKAPELGPTVLIIGGGNSAIDSSRSVLRLGAKPILVYRRREEDMPAIASEIEDLKSEGIETLTLTTPVRFILKEGRLAEVECTKMELGEIEADGRRQPIPVPGSEFRIPAETVIHCIGETGDLQGAPQELKIEGEKIVADHWGRTSIPKIFAGGDIATGLGTVAHAIGSGRRGAQAIAAYLLGESNLVQASEKPVIRAADMNFDYWDPAPRLIPHRIPVERAVSCFDEIHQTTSREVSVPEANRCLHCAVSPEFHPEHCRACTNCSSRCPSFAISLNTLESPYIVKVEVEDAIMEQVRQICLGANIHPESIVCFCSSTRAMEIAAAILKGAKTPEEVSRETGARTGCGVLCIEPIFRLIQAAGIELGISPHPDVWYPTVPTIWDIPSNVVKKYEDHGFRFEEDKAFYEKLIDDARTKHG